MIGMDFLLTFLEGIITFVSPCLLPLLPVYLAYFAGGDAAKASLRQTVCSALCFVAGFTLVYALLGAGAGVVGMVLVRHREAFNVACGAVLVLLGLNYLGVLRIPVLERTWRKRSATQERGYAGSLLFGVVFAIGWSPCVGTFLASALSLAASSASAGRGMALLLCFSAGLGVPFVLSAALINQLQGAFGWVKRHYEVINRVCGGLLVVEGLLMAVGLLA